MKKNYNKHIAVTVFFIFSLFSCSSHAQVEFYVDSLIANHVIWISRGDVWIEDFANGPYFDVVFSMVNRTSDTMRISPDDIQVHAKFDYTFQSRHEYNLEKKVSLRFDNEDSLVIIPPGMTFYFKGRIRFMAIDEAESTWGPNYNMVNFLPLIAEMLKNATCTLMLFEKNTARAFINNCYVGKWFFVDGTYGIESIFKL